MHSGAVAEVEYLLVRVERHGALIAISACNIRRAHTHVCGVPAPPANDQQLSVAQLNIYAKAVHSSGGVACHLRRCKARGDKRISFESCHQLSPTRALRLCSLLIIEVPLLVSSRN